jgi:hypothetical protein
MRIPPLARVPIAIAASHLCVCAQSRINVAIFNYAAAPRWMLSGAGEAAHRALLGVHIESRWMICEPDACKQEIPAGAYMEVYLMPRLRVPLTNRQDGHIAGYAMPDAFAHPRVYAFYDAASVVAGRTTRPIEIVLGCIFLHETGHLLGLGHRPHGVMRANLEGDDMDSVAVGRAFSADEGERLRAALDPAFNLRAAALR